MGNIYINGYHVKTILVHVPRGADTIFLEKNNKLGIPDHFMVHGFIVRRHESRITAHDNRKLVPEDVFENAFFNLHVRDYKHGNTKIMLDNIALLDIANDGTQLIAPTLSKYIHWSNSHITLNKTGVEAVSNDDSVFEIVVLYTLDNIDTVSLEHNTANNRTGFNYLGEHYSKKLIRINNVQKKYSLSNTSTFGLPPNALVVGFSVNQSKSLERGNPVDDEITRCGYLSLQVNSTLLVDKFPLELTDYRKLLPFQLNYFPIVPIEAKKLNWQSSCLDFMYLDDIEKNIYYQLTLVYIEADSTDNYCN